MNKNLSESKKKKWRALVKVVSVVFNQVLLVVPSWNHLVTVSIPITNFPREVRSKFRVGYRFHAQVNIDCDDVEDLLIGPPFELK